MAVLTKEELLNSLKGFMGEEADDERLTFLENVQDTMTDLETRTQVNWQQKYEENDRAWRQRYRDRFFSEGTDQVDEDLSLPEPEKPKPLRFEDLFKEI